jgi:aryl-alcohol dehydrogenase-like predicted oxidoreductase
MHVLWHARVVAVGAWGRGRDRTDQIRVRHRHVIFKLRRLVLISGAIRLSYENGIQTFDTANVSPILFYFPFLASDGRQVYSNGASEIILGKAIKQLNLPREEIVVLTKVRYYESPTLCVQYTKAPGKPTSATLPC